MSVLVDVCKLTNDPKNVMETGPTMVGLRALDECIGFLRNTRKLILEKFIGNGHRIFDGGPTTSRDAQKERKLALPLPSLRQLYPFRVGLDQLECKMIERRSELINDFACDDLNICGSGNEEMKCLFTVRVLDDFVCVLGLGQSAD